MTKKVKSFMGMARAWIAKNKLHGPHAFLRYVMFVFVEHLNRSSNEFIFKGGNLLWVYIKTPRSTIDLDFVTRNLANDDQVKQALEKVCHKSLSGKVRFSIKSFEAIAHKGASVTIDYETEEGQKNSFDLDIVYSKPTLSAPMHSPIDEQVEIEAATLENIIADKVAACHQFKSGNTRMKDFDDLWRISQLEDDWIDRDSLSKLFTERNIPLKLDERWPSEEMDRNWKSHLRRNKRLPATITLTITEINTWLDQLFEDAEK